MSSSLASCSSDFAWMENDIGQDPCTIAAWLIQLCQDASSNQPALLAPLLKTSSGYKPPNGTSANGCTCSWAFYNNIEACTVCQAFPAEAYSTWSSSCDVLGQTSTTTYWQATVSFSERTKLPRWSILDPSKWSIGAFNATQAEEIANQNLPDVTDASASQPSVSPSESSSSGSSKKTNVGAIAGGVVAGVVGIAAIGFALWFFLYRRRARSRKRGPRRHIDLDADGGGILGAPHNGNPLASHLRSQSLGGYPGSPTSPTSFQTQTQMQQTTFQGYPVVTPQNQSQTSPSTLERNHDSGQGQGAPMNAVVGVTRTARNSRESIPTVAEQLDEKRRIRAQRQNPGAPQHRGSSGYAGTVAQTGSSSRSTSLDDLNSGGNTAAISHAISRSLSQSQIASTAGSNKSPSPLSGDRRAPANKRASRRLSLKKAPWNRRRTVMNVGSDAGSDAGSLSPPANTAPLPLGGTVAAEGQTTTASDVMAAVPGARLPTARDRVNPPPEYTNSSP